MAPNLSVKSNPMDAVAHIDRASFEDDEMGRLMALSKARALVQRLETPWEALVREIWLSVGYGNAIDLILHKYKWLMQ